MPERILTAEDWAKKIVERGTAAAEDWKEQALNPKKPVIASAVAADKKRADRLAEAEKLKKWLLKMQKLTEADYLDAVKATDPRDYSSGLERKASKIAKRIGALRPLVLELAKTIDGMPEDTDAQREAKMLAARRGMIAIGKKLAGV